MERRCAFKPGDVCEDCAFHPVLCTEVVYEGEENDGNPEWSLRLLQRTDQGTNPALPSTQSDPLWHGPCPAYGG